MCLLIHVAYLTVLYLVYVCANPFLLLLCTADKVKDTVAGKAAMITGLVRSVHAPDELLPAARALAAEIVENTAPVSVALCRQMLWKMLTEDHPMAAHRLDSAGIRALGNSADTREGVESFLEKRPARFAASPSRDMPSLYPWWDERPFGPPGGRGP